MGFSNGISEPIKRLLPPCEQCGTQFQADHPTKRSIETIPCQSCQAGLCPECPAYICENCGDKVCQQCAREHPEVDGRICARCLRDIADHESLEGYSADEYAERQTNILSGVMEESC